MKLFNDPDGYPVRYRVDVLVGYVFVVALRLMLAAMAYLFVREWWLHRKSYTLPAVFVFSLLFVWSMALLIDSIRSTPFVRLSPFFRQSEGATRIPGAETYFRGRQMMAKFGLLERLAAESGVRPLSSFMEPDVEWHIVLRNPDRVRWHDTTEGVKTVDCLLSRLKRGDVQVTQELIDELEAMLPRLRTAEAQGVPFCLEYEREGSMNGQKWAALLPYI